MLAALADVFRGVTCDQMTFVQDPDIIADGADIGENMGTDDDDVVVTERANVIEHLALLLRVESYGRLIENDDLGIIDDRLRKADTLAVAFGQVFDQTLADTGGGGAFQRMFNRPGIIFSGDAFQIGGKGQIFAHGHIGVHRGNLRQIADVLLCLLRLTRNIEIVDLYRSGCGGEVTRHDVHGRGFACAVGPEKAVDMAFFGGECEVVDSLAVSVALCEMFYLYHLRCPSFLKCVRQAAVCSDEISVSSAEKRSAGCGKL